MYFSFPFLCHLGSTSGNPADNVTFLLLIALLLHSLNLSQLVIQMRNQHENCSQSCLIRLKYSQHVRPDVAYF